MTHHARPARRGHPTAPARPGPLNRPAGWAYRVLVVTLAVAVVGSTALAFTTRRHLDYGFFDPLIDIRAIIDRYAVEPPDDEQLQLAAIRGMIEALDDPYAEYAPPRESEDFNKDLTGEYVGIGAEVTTRSGYLHIVTPLDGSPAFRAGLMAGDDVLAIDGASTENKSVDESIALLKGEPGAPVNLRIGRDGQQLDITVVRDHIRTPAVKGIHRLDGDRWSYLLDRDRAIAYFKLTQFTPTSAKALRSAIDAASAEAGGRLNGLIIDLRFNPGGVLDQAVEMADMFLSRGVIVSTKGPAHPEEVYEATPDRADIDAPLALLINGQSASASEVLSGALVESGRAITIGSRTFGKGSVQSVRGLSGSASGAIFKLTEQRYYLPSGRSIQRTDDSASWGVDPADGFFIPMTEQQTIDMLTAARQRDLIGARDAVAEPMDWSTPEAILQNVKDPQLAAALRALLLRLDSGEWQPVGQTMADADPALVLELADLRRAEQRGLREFDRLQRRIRALENAAGDPNALTQALTQAQGPIDLIPDDAEIVGGQLVIKDADGRTVATLDITGPNLERWLIDAGVRKPQDQDDPQAAPSP